MTITFKKILAVITGLVLAGISQVNAVDNNASDYFQAACCEAPRSNFNLRGELLYWRSELCGLESAFGSTTISTTVNGAFITTTVNESDVEPDFRWNPGFRIGADLSFNCLILEADWTHFNGGAKFNDSTQFGRWKIDYDTIDLTLGRRFCAAPCFYFKPFIGVRALKINQSLQSHLETLFVSLIGNNIVTSDLDDREEFWGIGPQIGIEANWYLGNNFSIYGSFAAIAYYGEVKGTNFDTNIFTSTISVANGRRKHCFNTMATDGTIGIRWDRSWCFSCYQVNLMMKLGLEQNRIYDFSNLGADGTLSLDGGTFAVGAGICF